MLYRGESKICFSKGGVHDHYLFELTNKLSIQSFSSVYMHVYSLCSKFNQTYNSNLVNFK